MVLESPYTNIREAAAHVPITVVRPGALPVGVPQPWPPTAGEGCSNQSQRSTPPHLCLWQIYRLFPGFGYLILDSLALGNMFFRSDEK